MPVSHQILNQTLKILKVRWYAKSVIKKWSIHHSWNILVTTKIVNLSMAKDLMKWRGRGKEIQSVSLDKGLVQKMSWKNKETTTIMVLRQFRHRDKNITIKTVIFEMLTEKMFYIRSWQKITSKLGQKWLKQKIVIK